MVIDNKDIINMMDHKYALFGLFIAFNNRLQAVGDTFYDEITCKQFFFLACMNLFMEDAPTMNEMAKVMGCSRQNVKQIVDSLERKNYIELRVCKNDKRKQQIYRTSKAFEVAKKYSEREKEFISFIFKGVSAKEVDNTYKTLEKIENNLKGLNK